MEPTYPGPDAGATRGLMQRRAREGGGSRAYRMRPFGEDLEGPQYYSIAEIEGDHSCGLCRNKGKMLADIT